MKRHAFRWTIAAMTTLLLSVSAFAVPVTDDEAAAAAASLVAAGGVMDARMEGGVSEVRALTPPDGVSPFRVVKFADGGFVVTSGDTEDDPFVFISDGPGDVVENDENPLWGILRHNMSANEAARPTSTTARSGVVRLQSASAAENKWAKWLSGSNGRARLFATADGTPVPSTSISDICVPRIMDVRWNQRGSGIASHYYNDAIPHHCAVGCVAVAMAQIIRHYQWPSSIGCVKRLCQVWNGEHGDDSLVASQTLTTSGATYDWSAMPAAPDLYANPPGQAEVSRFLYDVGITARTRWYAPDNDSSTDGGSGGSTIRDAADALKTAWGYVDVVWTPHYGLVPDPDEDDDYNSASEQVFKRVKNIYLPCLAAGMPVMVTISGHEIVADGYGYSDGNLYFHINYGWGGTNSSSAVTKNTGWYFARGPIQGHEDGLGATIYNISTNRVGSLFSGRIYAPNGSPAGDIPVYAVGTNGVQHVTRANAAGIYAFNLEPGHYVVFSTNDSAIAYGEVVTIENRSTSDGQSLGTVGNVGEVDMHLVQRQGGFSYWTGAGDGTSFSDPANWDPAQVPAAGSTIVFPPVGSGIRSATLNNDVAASAFKPSGIVFLPSSPCYTVTNNAILGVSAIVNGSSATNMFKVTVAFSGDIDVTGPVAFVDGGSANGAKPVNHNELLGLYNLTAPDWEPAVGATIASNAVINVPSMLIHTASNLTIKAGGTLNVAGDVVLTTNGTGSVSLARTNNGLVDISGWLRVEGLADGSSCYYGTGTIRAYGIYSNSGYGPFRLCDRVSTSEILNLEIGAGGLAKGPNLRSGDPSYSLNVSGGDGVRIKALTDFPVQGCFSAMNEVWLDTDGHVVTFEDVVSMATTLTIAGGGAVRIAGDARHLDFSNRYLRATVNVDEGTTLALDSGSLLTSNRVTVAEGATLALTLSDPAVGATLGGRLSMSAGSTLVFSNFTGAATPPLSVKSFEKTGEGRVFVRVTGPAPVNERILLATGFGDALASDFECVECSVLPGSEPRAFDISGRSLVYGSAMADCIWKGTSPNWSDPAAWQNPSNGLDVSWSNLNNAIFQIPGQKVYLAADAMAADVSFAADASVVGNGLLSACSIFVSRGVTAAVSAPLSSGVIKTGEGTLVLSRSREGKETFLSEGILRFTGGVDIGSLVFGTDPEKKVVLDYGGQCLATPRLTDLLRVGMDETLTNGVFGTGTDSLTFTEANLPSVLTIAKDAVVSNEQNRIYLKNDSGTYVINIAGGKMYNTKSSGGNHYLMQASKRGRVDINLTDGGILEYWNELYALTCRDGTGYVNPSLHITMRDSAFRFRNNKSFRFGWDSENKNAVSPVGVFAATNSVFEAYGFFLGHDTVGANTAGSYTADFEGCIVSARQVRVFHDRPLNAIRFNNTRLVLTASDDKWLTAAAEFNSSWNVNPITIGEGGLVMDSNGKNGTLVADLQGPGAITKVGSGTLTINRSQTGTGPLVCQAGGMYIGCNSVARPITVKDGARLSVITSTKASLGDLALESGATVSILSSTLDTAPMSVSALTLPASGTATLQKNGGTFSAGTYAVLEMPGITVSQVLGRLEPAIESGLGYSYVVVNGVLKLVVGASGYTYVPAVAPTCESPGNIAYLQGSDGNCYDVVTQEPLSLDDVTLDPLGHDWTEWTVVRPATFACAGEKERSCRRDGCGEHETREIAMLRHSTFTVSNSGNTFTITRSETNVAETVRYHTTGLSAYAGQNFTERSGTLTFAPGVLSTNIVIVERTPSVAAYKYQAGTTRAYRLEVVDVGGFLLASTNRSFTTGSSFSSSYINRSVTNLVYFTNGGSIRSGVGNKYLDMALSGNSSYVQVNDSGYDQAVHTISTGSLFGNNSALRSYLNELDYKMYATIYFTQKEEQDGYQYIQILADNSSTHDGDDGDGKVSTPSVSLYKACFILSYNPSGSVMSDDHYQFFPHRYDYIDKAAEKSAGISQYEFDYDNSHLYQQAFKSATYRAPTSGSLVLPVTVNNLNVRFDAAGSGGDTWDFKNLKARLALVDATPPTLLAVSVSPGPYHRGNTVSVSLAFSEIVVTAPSSGFVLNTSWGHLGYDSASSGGNVLTFTGHIQNSIANGKTLSLDRFVSLTSIKDLAGNAFSGSIGRSLSAVITASVDYAISYDLAGGVLPQGEGPNPTTYNYDSDFISLANPVREGYTFDGWSGTGLIGLESDVVIAPYNYGDREYVAHWTPIPKPPYPPYLENADSDIVSNYDEWAERYGYDPNGEHEAAFLLDVAPEAITNGVTLLSIAEMGATNVVVEGSVYEMVLHEFMMSSIPETLPCRRFVLASGAGPLKPGPWREYNGMGGAGFDVCNGYLVLHVSTDLSQPKDEWVDLSWFVDFEGDHAVVTIPEMFLESARQSIENSSGRAASGLFLSVGIATEEVFDMNALFLLSQPNEN